MQEAVGLLVNIASAWLLSGDHAHGHGHGHGHFHPGDDEHTDHSHEGESKTFDTSSGVLTLSIFEDGVPPVFRIRNAGGGALPPAGLVTVTTVRPDGTRHRFRFAQSPDFLESVESIPEPHAFTACVALPGGERSVEYDEHDHGAPAHGLDTRDHNIRAAYVHVIGDAAVSVLAIIGLMLAKFFGWLWMDPLAGIVGALVIANWSYWLLRDTGAILLDMSPTDGLEKTVRDAVEKTGDDLLDLHVWRLGPGHFGAVLAVVTQVAQRGPAFYHEVLRRYTGLSHITVEVHARKEAS